jgi:polar amino acid transport system substrate-binding protein
MRPFVTENVSKLFVVILFVLASLIPMGQLSAQTIRVCVIDQKAEPFYMSAVGEPVASDMRGVTFDLFDQIGAQLNIKFKFERWPWKRCVQRLKKGEVDALPHVVFRESRMEWARFPLSEQGGIDSTQRIYHYPYSLYYHKKYPIDWDGKRFSRLDKPIGALLAFDIVSDLKKQGVEVIESADMAYLLTLLQGRRISALASYAALADPVIRDGGSQYDMLIKHETPLKWIDGYLAFSHYYYWEHAEIAEAIWCLIREMREAGEIEKLIEKYRMHIAEKYK